jgi:hypothetical protein
LVTVRYPATDSVTILVMAMETHQVTERVTTLVMAMETHQVTERVTTLVMARQWDAPPAAYIHLYTSSSPRYM